MEGIEFRAPGPGVWELEQTHFTRAATRYVSTVYPEALAKGFGEGTRRYGLLLDTLVMRPVNDFIYTKFRAVGAPEGAKGPPPKLIFQLLARLHPAMRERNATAAEVFPRKLWREDLERWDKEVKPDSIARNGRLQSVSPDALGDAELIKHLEEVCANQKEMVYRHHVFTVACTFPVGHFLNEAQQMTALPSGELLGLLKGSSPVSRGAEEELAEVTRLLREHGVTAARFREMPGADALRELMSMPNGIGEAVLKLVDAVGYRLVSGYDICDSYALEMPDMLLRTIFAESRTREDRSAEGRLTRVREQVPRSDLPRFDELLGEARFINRLRDERGVFNDLWGGGLARRAVLAAGRLLEKDGALPDGALAINASNDELVELLRGGSEPSVEELRRRQTWRDTKTFADAPPYLGGQPSPPPPVEWLPRQARANARSVDTIIRELFHVSQRNAKPRSVEGLAVHPGVYEGPVRLVKGPEDFGRLQQGDVLVTRTTGPAFNLVLPLLGALVTDRGGQLSHAAIVAREYGIPAVVGTRDATSTFPDGARVRVDGNAGRVELLS